LYSRDLFMTRITNLGRKRTHVEATFNYHEADLGSDAGLVEDAVDESVAVADIKGVETAEDGCGADGQPPKKKRKRGPRKKAGVKAANGTCGEGEGEEGVANEEGVGKDSKKSSEKKGKGGKAKSRTLQDRKEASFAMAPVISRHDARRTRRKECTPMAEAASCAEKLTTWRGTVN